MMVLISGRKQQKYADDPGARTVVWNGPMGVFERRFARGTEVAALAVAEVETAL